MSNITNIETEDFVQNGEWQNLNSWIQVMGHGCHLQVVNRSEPEIIVRNINELGLSKIYFKTDIVSHALAMENWFQFQGDDHRGSDDKNIYFNNYVRLHTRINEMVSCIQFVEMPTCENTKTTSPISAKFNILNKDGEKNDSILTIKW